MAFSSSGVFRVTLGEILGGRNAFALGNAAIDGDEDYVAQAPEAMKVALFNNAVDTSSAKDATFANAKYDAGVWLASREAHSTEWPVGGRSAENQRLSYPSANTIMFDMDDTSASASTSLSNIYGALVYHASSDVGVCFNYFGGSNSVSGGTLTVVWNANGLFRITV